VSSVSTGIKRCYCATEDSTNCAREPRWQKILTAKMAKEKIAKGEAATETSELGTTRSLDLLRASAESWYDGVYVNIRRRYSGGLTLLANYTWSKDLEQRTGFPLADPRVFGSAKQ
jgi:hypothetical protein